MQAGGLQGRKLAGQKACGCRSSLFSRMGCVEKGRRRTEREWDISAAVGGMLKRHLAPETLERLLRNELLNDKQEEKRNGPLPFLGLILGGNKEEGGDRS